MLRDRSYITGFMCAGKSTVARTLANFLTSFSVPQKSWESVETDYELERMYGPIPEIFDTHGEAYFRQREFELIQKISAWGHIVVSTGGGMFTFEPSRELMLRTGTVIWIDAPFDVIVERYKADPNKEARPLFRNIEKARALYESRRVIYQLAHLRVDGSKAAIEVVAEIVQKLKFSNVHS